jgi:glycosyltransferase 2 family protein
MRHIRQLIPYFVMLLFAAWCVVSLRGDLAQLSLAPVLRAWDLVVLASLLSLLNYLFRIIRWRTYLRRLGHRVPMRFAALTFTAGFAYTLSPGKIGEMVRARYYVPLGVPLSDVAAAFFTERFLDLVAMIALAALLFSSESSYANTIMGGAIGAVVILLSVAFLPWAAITVRLKEAQRLPASLRSLAVNIASALASARALMSPGMLLLGFVLGLMAWGLEGAGLGLLSSMFPPVHLDATTAIGIYGVAVLIGGLSFLPGGLGSTEAVMTALLATHGYTVSEALLVTLTCRLVTLWLGVIVGWGSVFALRQRTVTLAAPWK